MDILAVGLSDDARTGAARPHRRSSRHLRRTKVVTAVAITALIGVGSYAATYRALVLISTPSPPTPSIAPAPSGSTPSPTVPAPVLPKS